LSQFWSYERAASVGSGSISMTQVGVSLAGASCAPLVQTCVDMTAAGQFNRHAPSS
jgi:hypothetical protein